MRGLLTTQSQNCYREQIQKEMLTRLAWKGRYARHYPTCCNPRSNGTESTQPPLPPPPPPDPRAVLLPDIRSPGKQSNAPPPPPPPPPQPTASTEGEGQDTAPPLMRPVSPRTRRALFQDSSHHQGRGRSLYLQRRGQIKPEEKFDFPLLSSWEYGWRLGDYSVDYRTPSRARSSVVKNTFYARNGVFSSPAVEA